MYIACTHHVSTVLETQKMSIYPICHEDYLRVGGESLYYICMNTMCDYAA